MPEAFECTTLAKKALYKYSSFPFTLLLASIDVSLSFSSHVSAMPEPVSLKS